MLADANKSFENQKVVISGSGNVAIYAAEKATTFGAKVIAMSDSNGYIYDPNGINLDVVKQIKEVERKRIKEYVERVDGAEYHDGCSGIWTIPCDIALPCATQNEIDELSAKTLVANGCYAVGEGANMPSTPEAIATFQSSGILFAPAKAANAGGVATSGLEMTQNSMRLSWTFEEVDEKLHGIMVNIYRNASKAAADYGMPGNLVAGANIAGFLKVAEAMKWQGVAY
jgi:glutamate dehydrogenase (NADP+)